jgi:hypothetical protein
MNLDEFEKKEILKSLEKNDDYDLILKTRERDINVRDDD